MKLKAFNSESGPRLGRRSSLINCRREPRNTGLGSTPPLSAHLPRRFAARSRTSLAHVDVSWPAAASSSARWASVSLMRNSAALRSFGAKGGRPIFGCFSMTLNVATKYFLSTIAIGTFCCYNKSSRDKKTPVQPWRATSGQIIRLVAESS
jgi:hypothetical protein